MNRVRDVTPRQQERRDRILECTRLQVARLGYEGVNMRDLAIAANVSTATLYNLYNSKDELILAAVQDLLQNIRESLRYHPPGLSHLMARFEFIADVIVDNPRYADAMGRMLFAAEPSAPIVGKLITESRDQIIVDLETMRAEKDLISSVDLEKLARDLTANSWASILMLMKGFIALHNFRDEYLGAVSAMLLPWLHDSLEQRFREKTGMIR